jgi:hypothetical protein
MTATVTTMKNLFPAALKDRFAVTPLQFWTAVMYLGIVVLYLAGGGSIFAQGGDPFQAPFCNFYTNVLLKARPWIIGISFLVIALGLMAAPIASRFSAQARQQFQPVIGGTLMFTLALPLGGLFAGSALSCP